MGQELIQSASHVMTHLVDRILFVILISEIDIFLEYILVEKCIRSFCLKLVTRLTWFGVA